MDVRNARTPAVRIIQSATWAGEPVGSDEHGIQIPGGVTELVGLPEDLAAFGEAVAMRWQSPVMAALAQLADALDELLDVGPVSFGRDLTCDAVDALAEVLARSGHHDTAVQVLGSHSAADDEPDFDRHADLRALGIADERDTPDGQSVVYRLRDAAAADYLRALTA